MTTDEKHEIHENKLQIHDSVLWCLKAFDLQTTGRLLAAAYTRPADRLLLTAIYRPLTTGRMTLAASAYWPPAIGRLLLTAFLPAAYYRPPTTHRLLLAAYY